MDKKKIKMTYTSEENEDSSNEDCPMEESYERSKISNVLVFYVNGKEVRTIIYNFYFKTM